MRIALAQRVSAVRIDFGRLRRGGNRDRCRQFLRGRGCRPSHGDVHATALQYRTQLFELIRILLCHDGGTRINERRYNLAFNHLDERVDAQLPDLLWELRD